MSVCVQFEPAQRAFDDGELLFPPMRIFALVQKLVEPFEKRRFNRFVEIGVMIPADGRCQPIRRNGRFVGGDKNVDDVLTKGVEVSTGCEQFALFGGFDAGNDDSFVGLRPTRRRDEHARFGTEHKTATAGESQQNFGFAVAVFQGRQGFRDFCHVNGIIG